MTKDGVLIPAGRGDAGADWAFLALQHNQAGAAGLSTSLTHRNTVLVLEEKRVVSVLSDSAIPLD
jgi:hypothetical protein